MKKLIFGAAVLASAFFAASCQQEMLDPQAEGTTVTYTVEVPDAIATKAIGDGFRLHYEVYRQDYMNETAPVYEGTREFSAGKATVELEFVKDQEFYVLFWAQQINGAQAYNIGDLRNVSLNTLVANDLTAEVFAGNDHVSDCKSDKNGNVVLVRPVAQLNIATTADSFTLGTEGSNTATVVPTTSEVVVNGLYDTYNVATGTAGTKASRTYTEYAVPGSDFKGTAYKLMATNYLGFIPQAGDNVEVTFTINTTTEAEPIVHTVSNVPVKANYQTNILGNLISAIDNYQVTLEDWADGEITHPLDGASLQTALDNAVPGTTIQLEPGVNYGTLYLRPSANADITKVVDWVGNNYRYETYSLFQDITIKGAEGATVDAIEIEGGTYYNTPHSQSSKYPIMLSLIELKNVVIDGVTFTGKGGYDPQGHGNAINLSGNNIKVDGLTIQNCTLNNPENNARLIYKTESTTTVHTYEYDDQTKALKTYTFTPSLKDITVTGTTFNGGYIGMELRETENVTITNNTFNVADRNILLAVNTGCTYSGKITITGNVSNNAQERFVRMSGAGNAKVEIKDNRINNYQGADADYIKVTDGTNVTIENNVLRASTAAALQYLCDLATGTTNIKLGADIVGDVTVIQKQGVKITVDGQNHKYNGSIKVHSNSNHYADAALTIQNVNFETSVASLNFIEALENGAERYSTNITAENCTFTATGDAVNTAVGLQIKSSKWAKVEGCTATDMHSLIQAQSCDETVVVNDCTINGKNGVAFKAVKAATVEDTEITATGYGIRFDGDQTNYGIVVKGNNVTAAQPFIVRRMTGTNNTITLEGTNTLTTEAEYQIVITNGEDDEAYVKPTGTYTLTGAEGYTVFPAPFPVASWDEFTAALAAGEDNIKLTADITYDANYQLQKAVTIDLNKMSMTLPMINIHTKSTVKNGTINGKVYARKNAEIVFDGVTFSGAVADNLSTEGHLAIQGGCKLLYAKNCLFSPTSVSGSQTKPLSFEGGSTQMKFENCEFKSSPYKKQVYFNSLSASATLDFTNCNFNNKTPNIMFAAACPLTNLTMSGTTKLSSVTLETNRAKDAVTADDLAYLSTMIAHNSFSSVRLFYAGGSSEYIR